MQEDVTTDNTAHAPLLTLPVYTTGGTLYWRVAAIDAERNQGDYSPAQKIGLAKKMRVYVTRFPVRGRKSAASVKVVDMANKPVAGAAVRVTGKGLRVGARRTTRAGTATFIAARPQGPLDRVPRREDRVRPGELPPTASGSRKIEREPRVP